MADDRIERLRAFYEGLALGDLSAAEALFDFDALRVCEPAGLPYGGEYLGKSGLHEGIAEINSVWKRVRFEDLSFAVGDDMAVVRFTMTAISRATGRALSMPVCEYWKFRDGRAVELAPFYWDTHLVREVLGLS